MLRVEVVCERDGFVVPAVVPGLVPTQEKNGSSVWVEGEEDAVGAAFMLGSELLDVREPLAFDRVRVRSRECGTEGGE